MNKLCRAKSPAAGIITARPSYKIIEIEYKPFQNGVKCSIDNLSQP